MTMGSSSDGRFVLGILATRGTNRPASSRDPFPGRTRTFQEMTRLARKQDVDVAVFSPKRIDKRHLRVLAWVFVPRRGWIQRYYPLPSVIYNRVANRRAEARPSVQGMLAWLKTKGVVVFNPRFLDKWDVYAALQADQILRPSVPETVLYTNPGQVLDGLRRWAVVYCKPRRGSLGTGIAALWLSRDGRVAVRRNGVGVGTVMLRLPSTQAACRWADQRLRPYRYCLQKGVKLATTQGRRFDIRALVQKDGQGTWRFTGAAARVAGRGQLTTHVPRGGSRLALRSALGRALRNPLEVERVEQELAELSEAAAVSLEKDQGEVFGEFSLDVGLDKEGKLWILEVNAKPFRFDEAEIRHRAFERLIAFARYLGQEASTSLEDADQVPVASPCR